MPVFLISCLAYSRACFFFQKTPSIQGFSLAFTNLFITRNAFFSAIICCLLAVQAEARFKGKNCAGMQAINIYLLKVCEEHCCYAQNGSKPFFGSSIIKLIHLLTNTGYFLFIFLRKYSDAITHTIPRQ